MSLSLDLAYDQPKREGRLGSLPELQAAIMEGRSGACGPMLMTVATISIGLVPVTGADAVPPPSTAGETTR